jgi:hypothetical protein
MAPPIFTISNARQKLCTPPNGYTRFRSAATG